jgi:ABC-type ATPase involved in cell division
MHSSEAAVEIENLAFRAPNSERDLIEGLSLTVRKAEMVVLLSDNSSATSWLVRLLAGDPAIRSGSIRIAGRDISILKRVELQGHRSSIGLVSADVGLLDDRDLWTNVVLPLELDDRFNGSDRHRVEKLLREFGLLQLRDADIASLTISEVQKALLVRALVREPLLLILDDPTIGLNREHIAEILGLLETQRMRGMTIVIASTDMRLAQGHSARVVRMSTAAPAAAILA